MGHQDKYQDDDIEFAELFKNGVTPTRGQAQFGNMLVETVRNAVRELGWEEAAARALLGACGKMARFIPMVPNMGEPGQTIVTTKEFEDAYQELLTGAAVLTALLAERHKINLKAKIPAEN